MGVVLTVAQQKGGSGKTTLAAHLAVALARDAAGRARRVAVLDIDPQGSLSRWFATREGRSAAAGLTEITMVTAQGWRTRNEVDRLSREHDVVVIDSPPHAETESRLAIRAAGLVILPVQPSPLDVWATEPTLALAAAEKSPALLVLNRVPPRGRVVEDMAAELAALGAKTGATVARSRIGNRVGFAAAMAAGLTAGEDRPSSPAAAEIEALAAEIAALLQGQATSA